FPLHDLTHVAVESALDLSRGFYGLIAAGWDIADTTGKGSRGALPEEALWVEHLVGMLDAERAGGVLSGAEELNQHARAFAAEHKLTRRADLTDEQLRNIRTSAADLHGRWMTLPAGQTLVPEFGKGR